MEPLTIACTKEKNAIIPYAKDFLEARGFTIDKINFEEGYLKTAPKKIETVSEIISNIPKYVAAELALKNGTIFIRGYQTIFKLSNASPSRSGAVATLHPNDTEEVELQQDERMFRTHVQPLADHLEIICK